MFTSPLRGRALSVLDLCRSLAVHLCVCVCVFERDRQTDRQKRTSWNCLGEEVERIAEEMRGEIMN